MIFSLFLNSAAYYFFRQFFKKKEFVSLSFLAFYIYELTIHWSDFRFLPYPDQIARNMCLFVLFGLLINQIICSPDWKKYTFLSVVILWCMGLTHLYSFVAFYYFAFLYFLFLLIVMNQRKILMSKFLWIFFPGLLILPERLGFKLLISSYFKRLELFLNENISIFVFGICLLILSGLFLFRKRITNVYQLMRDISYKRIVRFILLLFIVTSFLYIYLSLNSMESIRALITIPRPYDFKLTFFENISLILFFLSLIVIIFQSYRKILNLDIQKKMRIIFVFTCVFSVFLLKIKPLSLLFIKVVSETFVRRYFHLGLFSYLLIPTSLYVLAICLPDGNLRIRKTNKHRLFIYALLILLILFVFFGLKRDTTNQYVMKNQNVFEFINRNSQNFKIFNVIGIDEYFVRSQLKKNNQISFNRFDLTMVGIADNVINNTSYVLLYRLNERCPYTKKSIPFIIKKIEQFPELFEMIYKDEVFSLYSTRQNIIKNIKLNIEKTVKELIDNNKIEEAYNQVSRLLLLDNPRQYLYLHEDLREKIYQTKPQYVKLTPTFSNIQSTSIGLFSGDEYNMDVLLDEDAFPSDREKIFLKFNKLDDNREHYYVVHFLIERNLHELIFEWENDPFRAESFSVYAYYDDYFETLAHIENNTKTINKIVFDPPKKVRNIKIVIDLFPENSDEVHLQRLEIR